MKKITRTVTKQVQETVQVCDTCEQEKPLVIRGSWSSNCRYDTCYDDYGRFEFCSFDCFRAKVGKVVDTVEDDEKTFLTRLTINMRCDEDGWEEFLAILKAYGPITQRRAP